MTPFYVDKEATLTVSRVVQSKENRTSLAVFAKLICEQLLHCHSVHRCSSQKERINLLKLENHYLRLHCHFADRKMSVSSISSVGSENGGGCSPPGLTSGPASTRSSFSRRGSGMSAGSFNRDCAHVAKSWTKVGKYFIISGFCE